MLAPSLSHQEYGIVCAQTQVGVCNVLPKLRKKKSTKRKIDLLIVAAAAPVWLPVLVLSALAVKISDPSAPVLFSQDRTGYRGARFKMLKLRTMVSNAEELKSQYREFSTVPWPDFKMDDDPRITRLGKIFRKFRVDEMPQILNVISGDMTLIGPRPTSFNKETYKLWHTERLDVVPGLTGSWQILGDSGMDFDGRSRLDIRYVRSADLMLDARIFFQTFPAMCRGK